MTFDVRGMLRWLPLAACLLVAGCGPSRPDRVPVSGVVVIDGKPVTEGTIQFHPASGRTASGELDKQGRFTLNCFEDGDGCVVGKNTVTVVASESLGSTKIRWLVPKKYMEADTSDISFEINEPTENLKVELTWDGGKPFVETISTEEDESEEKPP